MDAGLQVPSERPANCMIWGYRHSATSRWCPSAGPSTTPRRLPGEERTWLAGHCERLLRAYHRLSFDLPEGMIHGDACWGNLLRDEERVVLADWDAVSTGPRKIDLIPTLQAPPFRLPDHEQDAFIAAHGHDIRRWDGCPVLRDIRDLSTMAALLRDAVEVDASCAQVS